MAIAKIASKTSHLNRRQVAALQAPCLRAMDTLDPRFSARMDGWSTTLSINK